MTKYTVFGLWEDNGQTYSEHVEADDQYHAMGIVGSSNASLTIIGAIEGHHRLLTPGEDNWYAAAGEDMAELVGLSSDSELEG
jgi:hypothetical protein